MPTVELISINRSAMLRRGGTVAMGSLHTDDIVAGLEDKWVDDSTILDIYSAGPPASA
jgi:hypothetical protein